ncbi:MAG: hypothetical protein GEU77_02975 [Deltaproteobacteria bacterium]|nr:hypothetical protein [Deltaproteobacteria bacterium]
MRISRTTVLLLCTGLVTMTSIGMSSFSLFLRPLEADFGWSRAMVTLPYMFAMLGWGVGAVLFGKLAGALATSILLLALEIPNELVFFLLVAVAIGPTFGTVAVQNVIFYEIAGPRMAGVILGLSFIVHQIGSAGGPMFASIAFDMTGSYDGFMMVMALILLVSGVLIYSDTRQDMHPTHSQLESVSVLNQRQGSYTDGLRI